MGGTYDGSRTRLFVDGRQVGTGTPVPAPGRISYTLPAAAAQVGSYGGCNLSYTGDIDEASVWGGALSSSEVETIQRVLLHFASRSPRPPDRPPAVAGLARLLAGHTR